MKSMQNLLDNYRCQKKTTVKKEEIDFAKQVFAITTKMTEKPNHTGSDPQLTPQEIAIKVRYHVRRLKIARRQLMMKKSA